jgi:hypothetical protein
VENRKRVYELKNIFHTFSGGRESKKMVNVIAGNKEQANHKLKMNTVP